MKNFALTGVAGHVAPRHLQAIRDTGNRLVAALDPHDSAGVLDEFYPDAAFFTTPMDFETFVERSQRGPAAERTDWVSICSPNDLHSRQIRFALRTGADVICEKPLVLDPGELDELENLERESGRRVSTVLQLRRHPALSGLRERLAQVSAAGRARVDLTFVTARGAWYGHSWKGDPARSGGLATNIGIHLFDLLLWLFGPVTRNEVHLATPRRTSGWLELARADVRWFLSIDATDLPFESEPGRRSALRLLSIEGDEIDFSKSFGELHTVVYREALAGRGFGIADARGAIELVHRIRSSPAVRPSGPVHPLVARVGQNHAARVPDAGSGGPGGEGR